MMRSRNKFGLVVMIICFFSSMAMGTELLVENFNYTLGTSLTANGWSAHSGSGTNPIDVTSGLSFSGYLGSGIGGAANIDNTGEDVNKTFTAQTSGTVYVAFVIQTGSSNSSGYFLNLGQSTIGTTYFSKVWVNSTGNSVGIGTGATVAISANTPTLLVVKYTWSTKISDLFVFSTFPSSEPETADASYTESASLANVGSIALRQFNASESVIVDGIRIATTWAEAVAAPTGVDVPTSFSASTSSTSQINLSWAQNSNKDDVMVAWNSTDTFGDPSGSYSVSDAISGGGTVIFNGSGTSYNHTVLTANTAYYYKAWSVDGTPTYSAGVSANATTYKFEPTNHVTEFSATKDGTYGYNRIDLAWIEDAAGDQLPDSYLIKASTSNNVSDPVDGTAVSDNLTIGSNDGAVNIAHGNTSYEWAGLSAEQTYYFKIYPYTNSGSGINYLIDAAPSASATTDAAPPIPQIIISEIIQNPDAALDANGEWFELYNASGSTVNIDGWVIKDNGSDSHTIDNGGTLNILAGQFLVLGNSGDTGLNGNVAIDYVYSSFTLGNGDDEVILTLSDGSTVVDRVEYDGGTNWPDPTGASMVFTGTPSDDNNNYAYWTTATSPWSGSSGDYGSPGTNGSDQSLPVELSVWKAVSSKGLVKLFWTTDSEIENQGFIIERRQEGQTASDQAWKEIASFATNDDLLGQGSTSAQNDYFFIDKQVKVGQTYSYRLSDVDYRGNVTQHAAIDVTVKDAGKDLKPSDIKLHEAFPNPFNPSVNLSFTLEKETSALSLEIYDIQGALVQTLSSGYQAMGTHDFNWDGHDSQGNAVPSGVYLVRLGAGPVVQIQRVTLLR